MKNLSMLFLSLCIAFSSGAQTKISGVVLPDSINYGEHFLVLNGVGVHEKLWLDMYAGALYLPEKSSDAKTILKSEKPFAVKLYIVSRLISSKRMSNAVDDGFRKSTQGNTKPFLKKITQFKKFFNEEINKNDVFDLVYQPNIGVVVYKNNKKLGAIKGEGFKNALFGIWLSEHPADEEMKNAMLGTGAAE